MAKGKVTQNAVLVSDGKFFAIGNTADSVAEFLQLFNALPARPRSGYDKYYNDHGFVNPVSPESLSAQGVGKLLAKLYEVGYQIVGRGGDEAKEMTGILEGIDAYKALAPTKIAEAAQIAALVNAINQVGPDSEEAAVIRKSAEKRGLKLPDPAAVAATAANAVETVPAATVAESTGEPTEAELEEQTAPK